MVSSKAAITTTIRLILSVGLMVGVYTETGIFTTIALSLLVISIEIQALINKRVLIELTQPSLSDSINDIIQSTKSER